MAVAYHLTHDVRHLDRCRKEMLAAARFTDWHPEHFLDVAEMTFGLAVAGRAATLSDDLLALPRFDVRSTTGVDQVKAWLRSDRA